MRQQHYRFAHVVFAQAVLRDPGTWLARLRSQGAGALAALWQAAGAGLSAGDLVDGAALHVSPIDGAGRLEGVIVSMPAPAAPTECHYIAVVRDTGNEVRYFVLEKGVDGSDGSARAFWAEWRESPMGTMRIRGQDVVPVSQAGFLASVGGELGVSIASGDSIGGAFDGVAEALSGGPAPITGSAFDGAAQVMGDRRPVEASEPFGASSASPTGARPSAAFGPGRPPMPKKKSKAGLLVGCGCLSVFAFFALIGGVLLYLEEGRDYNDPGGEVASKPIQPGLPFTLSFKWNGTNYASSVLWLVVDGTTESGQFEVEGKVGCSRSGAPDLRDFSESLTGYNVANVQRRGETFSAWIRIHDEYDQSSSRPYKCGGVVLPAKGQIKKAKIVVTQRQRPSDWIAF